MPRLLIVTTVPSTVNAFLLPYIKHFRSQGWRVDGMACGITDDATCQAHFDRTWDIDWSRNPMDLRNFIGRPAKIRAIVAREGYDLVHVHTPVAAFVTRFALRARADRCPKVVYTAHGFHFIQGGQPIKNALFFAFEKLAARWTDALIVINREDLEAANRYRLLPRELIFHAHGIGVDTGTLQPESVPADAIAKVRHELGLRDSDCLLTMVAEFNPGKRHREAIHALAKLDRPDVHLAFAGVGPLEAEMSALGRHLGLESRLHFLGWRRDIPALIRASMATLLPSEREGLPRSVLESLALGVPVIGTEIRGIRDLLETGGGVMVPVGDIDRLREAIAELLAHPERLSIMAERGREQVMAFDIQRLLTLHDTLYRTVLGAGPCEEQLPAGTAVDEPCTRIGH